MPDPRPTLLELAELGDPDLVPEILPSSSSLALKAPAATLRTLFARAAAVVPQREVVPGTAHALLEAVPASEDTVAHLRITASDGEQTITVLSDSAIKVTVPGSVLLPPKALLDRLKLAPTEVVEITVVGTAALIRSGRARWTVQVPVGDVVDLNTLADVSGIDLHPVPGEAFAAALVAARKAASTSNARISLMQLLVRDGAITACDGGRLHKALVPGLDPAVDTAIPIRVADELVKTLSESTDSTLELGYNDHHLVFKVGSDSIVAQRLLIPFPDVQNLLLSSAVTNTSSLTVDRDELERAIARVSVSADPDMAVVTLATVRGARGPQDWTLEVRARDRIGNTALEVVDCQWGGKPREMSYNHHHLTDLLKVCGGETISLRLGEDTKSSRTPLLVETDVLSGIVQQVSGVWL